MASGLSRKLKRISEWLYNLHLLSALLGLAMLALLAVEFGKINKTIGFDLSIDKIDNYNKMIDPSGELSFTELKQAEHLTFTTDPANLKQADIIIVCVRR